MASRLNVTLITALAALALPAGASAAPDVRTAAGASPAALDQAVGAFRADLGELRPDSGQAYASGRREINWDGVPASFAAPNRLPGGFFTAAAPRGASFDSPGFGVEVFDTVNPAYTPAGFTAYSGQRLFTPVGSTLTDVRFSVPGTAREATTTAFGIVLSDVDTASGAALTFLDTRGATLLEVAVGAGGLSFVGVRFRDGERVARVRIRSGTEAFAPGLADTASSDVAAIDDVLFGEPQADVAPPAEPAPSPFELEAPAGEAPAGARLRASLIPLARKVRAGRTLKVVVGASADAGATLTLGRTRRTFAALAGAKTVSLRVPAKAKRGKQRLKLTLVGATGARGAKTAAVTVD